MKKPSKSNGDILPEYNFTGGVRGKYAKRYAKGSNVVVLDPDVAKIFSSSESVNHSLRNLAKALAYLNAQTPATALRFSAHSPVW